MKEARIPYPPLYIIIVDKKIVGGIGLIENDFYRHKELYLNTRTLYARKFIAKEVQPVCLKSADDIKTTAAKRSIRTPNCAASAVFLVRMMKTFAGQG